MRSDRISIAHRIYVGFGFLIIALLGLGAFAIMQFDQMSKSTETINEKITLVGRANEYALSLQELSDAILLYAKSHKVKDREAVDKQLDVTFGNEKVFLDLLTQKGLDQEVTQIKKLSAGYRETLEPLLLRIENIGASADMILMGANKLVNSAPELAEKMVKTANQKPDYAVLGDTSKQILVASNRALLDALTYALKPSDKTLQNARDATAEVDRLLGETKTQMNGLSRRERKSLKFMGRDNDLLKQGYVQFQGSNMGMLNSFDAYRQAIEASMVYASKIRATAIEAQNHTTASVQQSSQTTITSYGITMTIVAVIAALLGAVTSRSILGPLSRVTGDMKRLGDGDTEIHVVDRERRDEVGTMAKAVMIFRQNALDVERLTQQRLDDQKREEEKRSASLFAMADTIESETGVVLEKVAAQTRELGTAVGSMAVSAETVSDRAGQVAHEAEESYKLAQSVAEAADSLSNSIQHVSGNVERQRHIADTAIQQAHKSSQSVQTLSKAADSIGSVVALINDIAAQTNMLALNATIEAERAGLAGKGFAVVASEVKQLASQTANATAEIAKQIEGVRSVTQECVESIQQVNAIIDDMASISSEVSSSVNEQSQATNMIATNIQESFEVSARLNTQVREASEEMHSVRKLSEDLGGVSKRVGSMVESLQMSLNTAIRTASNTLNNDSEKAFLMDRNVAVTLRSHERTIQAELHDISNNGFALVPAQDVRLGEEFRAQIEGVSGEYAVEILSRHGLESPKTRIRFVDDMEERGEIVTFVVKLWADHLRADLLGDGNLVQLSDYRSAAE